MEPTHEHAAAPLQIRTPCPKRWDELTGDGRKRYCAACSLHVHNAAEMTAREARELVAVADSRVCMRIEYDSRGEPLFRDSKAAASPAARSPAGQLSRWLLSAAAGLLAACHGSVSAPATGDPEGACGGEVPPPEMGKVSTTVLGDVALPAPKPLEILGEAVAPQAPSTPQAPDRPPDHDRE